MRTAHVYSKAMVVPRFRARVQVAGEIRLLELVATGASLPQIVDALRAFVEANWSRECRCGLFLVDCSDLRSGQCIPRLDCWSIAIRSENGEVVGSLVIFPRESDAPTARQQDVIRKAAYIARIAMERARAEAALKRNEAFLAEAQRLSSAGSFAWRVPTDEIYWSNQLYRIYEFPLGEPVTLARICSRVHPDDREAMLAMFECARENGGDIEYTHRLLMPDGTVKHLYMVARGNRDDADGIEFLGAVQDITQRRNGEVALDKARAELAYVARVACLGALTASISHEVNQPLSGVITNANLSLRILSREPADIGGARDAVKRTVRDAIRASEVVARLRAMFQRREAKCESVDLNDAAREVVALSMCELQRNRVVVQTDFEDDLPFVTGDRVQLQQVILNLIVNASDAMAAVDDRPRVATIRTDLDGEGKVWLRVSDCGTGVAPQVVARLFEPFVSTKSDGMGIGLFVSRSIIENHDGSLQMKCNDGPGLTFSFCVPRKRTDRLTEEGHALQKAATA